MTLTASFAPLPDLADLGARWRALEEASDASFFLGWTWIGSWLEASGVRPELLAITDADGQDKALALIGHSLDKRRFGRVATLHLNEAGDHRADRPFIEYNGLLTHSRDAETTGKAAIEALLGRDDWRALRLSGLTPDNALTRTGAFRRRVLRDLSPAYFIDLEAVRAADSDYLSLLSANSRNQIRRSFKEHGDASIDRAEGIGQIDAWLERMRQLNSGRHADNAWEDASFRHFARTIAVNGLASGQVELLKIDCGGAETGYLLNFVYRGRAMNYQSAFIEAASSKSKPGLMCHAAAVSRYAAQGLSLYSLLAGKDRYKQSLSTSEEHLEWWTLERFSPALEIEALARKMLRH